MVTPVPVSPAVIGSSISGLRVNASLCFWDIPPRCCVKFCVAHATAFNTSNTPKATAGKCLRPSASLALKELFQKN